MAPRLEIDAHTIRMIAIAFVLLAALTVHRLWIADPPHGDDVLVLAGETMGTTWEIRIAGGGLDEELRLEVLEETERRLADIDRWMSDWNPESEISRFNAYDGTDGFPVSYETAELVAYAVELSKWTVGAFDITMGPLVARWGFGAGARIDDPPSQEELDELLRHTGARILRIGRGNGASGSFLRKGSPKTRIDLSAIAKGFGVDHVADGLVSLGRKDFLVEIGGELWAMGERPGGGPWRVAIEKPVDEGREIQEVIELRDQAMATSGDYRIFYREGDKRLSHTIDPRTGRPVEGGPASATVIAPNATMADGWATTLMVLGREGLVMAEEEGLGAMLLERGDGGEIVVVRNGLFPEARDAEAEVEPGEVAP